MRGLSIKHEALGKCQFHHPLALILYKIHIKIVKQESSINAREGNIIYSGISNYFLAILGHLR